LNYGDPARVRRGHSRSGRIVTANGSMGEDPTNESGIEHRRRSPCPIRRHLVFAGRQLAARQFHDWPDAMGFLWRDHSSRRNRSVALCKSRAEESKLVNYAVAIRRLIGALRHLRLKAVGPGTFTSRSISRVCPASFEPCRLPFRFGLPPQDQDRELVCLQPL
jgi:hypothetical protein